MKKILLFTSFLLLTLSLSAQEFKMSPFYYQRSSLFEQLPIGPKDIVFLGNSITNGCEWNELFNNLLVKNRGISGDLTMGVYKRLEPIVKGKPAKLFLLIGVNDISRGLSADSIAGNIGKIVEKVKRESPSTKIYLQSLLPFDGDRQYKNLSGRLDIAVEINKQLVRLAEKEKLTYIDLFPHFLDKNTGSLDAGYSNDGLHLMGNGYLLWRDLIIDYVNE